jgi:hypothetical protein
MREHFGIGFGGEMVFAFPQERVLYLLVIFNHAIMDDRELAAFVKVRVRILIGGFAVCRPTRVANSKGAARGRVGHQLRQAGYATGAFARLDMTPINDCDAG